MRRSTPSGPTRARRAAGPCLACALLASSRLLLPTMPALAAAAVSGCGGAADEAGARAAAAPQKISELRIVSLSPAISRTLERLGLAERVVGRTPWCDSLPEAVPVAGSLSEFDAERLLALRPTHVLVQPRHDGVDAGLRRLCEAQGWRLRSFGLEGLDEIDALIDVLPGALLPPGSPDLPALEGSAQALRGHIRAALEPSPQGSLAGAGRTLLLFAADPVMAFGRGSYLGDVLDRLGGDNVVDIAGYPQLSLEDVQRLQPDTVVLVRSEPGGADLLEARVGRLEIPAARRGRLRVLVHPQAMLPGPDVAEVAASLRECLEAGR